MSSSKAARVLIADANAETRDELRRLLVGQGYQVFEATEGDSALRAAREHRPDLVLSDVLMPRMDGFRLIEALRSDPAFRTTR